MFICLSLSPSPIYSIILSSFINIRAVLERRTRGCGHVLPCLTYQSVINSMHSHGCLLSTPLSFMWEVEHHLLVSRHGTHYSSFVKSKQTTCLPNTSKGSTAIMRPMIASRTSTTAAQKYFQASLLRSTFLRVFRKLPDPLQSFLRPSMMVRR